MTVILQYDELNNVNTVFEDQGEVHVLLTSDHARKLSELIVTVQEMQSGLRATLFVRMKRLAKGLLLTLQVMLKHGRLFELANIVFLKARLSTWQEIEDGQTLFVFKR
jgi:hypothetical protein